MPKTYDDVKDEHVGHTEENPQIGCFLCRKKGWIEKNTDNQKSREEKKKEKITELQEELEELREEIRDLDTFFEILDLSKDFNKKYKKLHRLDPEAAEEFQPYQWR